MLVQALAAYADEYLSNQLSTEAWEEKPVPYLIEIGPGGEFLAAVPRLRQEMRGTKSITLPQLLTIPKSPVNRNSGLHPLISADDIKYVLGIGPWTKADPQDQANAADRHKAFVKLLEKAALQIEDAAILDCLHFYGRPDQVDKAKAALSNAKAGTFLALSTPDGPLATRPDIRRFWNSHFTAAFQTRVDSGGTAECLVCGDIGPIAPTHDKIKGLSSVGGQASGVSLMSFDKSAFRSYGWEQNANSPVSPNRATAYVLALNDLLRSGSGKRKDVAGTAFIYWTRKSSDLDLFRLLDRAEVADVGALLNLDTKPDLDPNKFYMAGLGGNGARLQVRYWLADTLSQIKANVHGWFQELAIVNRFGQLAPYPKLWQLPLELERKGEPPAYQVLALLRRAIEGKAQPLGYQMLSTVLARLRHPPQSKPGTKDSFEIRFSPIRLALLRLCLNDISRGEIKMNESIDLKQEDPAYLCGRLLAEFESLQEAAYHFAGESKVNLTVADRYYSLASTNPRLAFPKLESLARTHFRKLNRNNSGAKNAIERKVIELSELIGSSFPPLFGLDGQGRFALGFYHQKAEHTRQRLEASTAKKAKVSSDFDGTPQDLTQ